MWVLQINDDYVWVGYLVQGYKFDGQFYFPHKNLKNALALVNYLNGGNGKYPEGDDWNKFEILETYDEKNDHSQTT